MARRRDRTMPSANSFNMVVGIDTMKMPNRSRQESLLVVDCVLECQSGSHRQDFNEWEPRCVERLERLP